MALVDSDNKTENKRERKTSEKDKSDVNDIVKKILKQQNYLRAHLNRLERLTTTTEVEPVREAGENMQKARVIFLKHF